MQVAGSGFAIEQGVLSHSECDHLLKTVSAPTVTRGRAGARHLLSHPAIAELASDPRLIAIANDHVGKIAVPFRATLFEKSARTNWLIPWHQDTALPLTARFESSEWGPWSEKAGQVYAHAPGWALSRVLALRVHLDASTADNGPLRVIPHSHLAGVLSDEDVRACLSKHNPVECLIARGGVLAVRPLLIHSSSKARSEAPRRVLHIEYADSLELGPGIRLAVV